MEIMEKKNLKYSIETRNSRSPFWLILGFVFACFSTHVSGSQGAEWQKNEQTKKEAPFIVSVKLPITESQVKPLIAAISNSVLSEGVDRTRETALVLRFDTSGNVTGKGSDFYACHRLAKFLTGKDMKKVRTIAYIPPPSSGQTDPSGQNEQLQFKSELSGHSLMVALACRQLWMSEKSSLKGIRLESDHLDLEWEPYRSYAKNGLKWPTEIVDALVGQSSGLFQVKKTDGRIVFVDQKERDRLAKNSEEVSSKQIVAPNSVVTWPARQLFDWSLIDTPILNRQDVVTRLGGAPFKAISLKEGGRQKKVALLNVDTLDASFADWAPRAIGAAITTEKTNLLILNMQTLGADQIRDAADFAKFIAARDRQQLETVAVISQSPTPSELMVALGCDYIVLDSEVELGPFLPEDLGENRPFVESEIRAIAEAKNREPSFWTALFFKDSEVVQYRNKKSGTTRIITPEFWESLPDKDDWVAGDSIDLKDGLTAKKALQHRAATMLESDLDKLGDRIGVPRSQWQEIRPNLSDRWVRKAARFISFPPVASLIIMIAMFSMFVEFSAPGLGVPGFISACLFSLFFWAQYFEGNAEWLEIILFLLGVAFIGIEIFIVPGFGVFGVGGIICLLTSLVLASQDFIIPKTEAETTELTYSLFTTVMAMMGVFGGAIFVKRYFQSIPILNKMVLNPPTAGIHEITSEERKENLQKYLNQVGVTVTVLRPAGRILIGSQVLDAASEGPFLEKGVKVVVCRVELGKITVREVGDQSKDGQQEGEN